MTSMSTCDQNYYTQAIFQAIVTQCGQYREAAVESEGAFRRNLVLRSTSDLPPNISNRSAFFASVELFHNPQRLAVEDASALRYGWDYAIDLDSLDGDIDLVLDTAALFREHILPMFGLRTYRMKFSGRKGVHIVIPNDSFATCFKPSDHIAAYPVVPKRITEFFTAILPPETLRRLKLDPALYNPRRLIRCAYSLHLESGLVAVPIWPEELERFNPERDARTNAVQVNEEWLSPKTTPGEASELLKKVEEWLQGRVQPSLPRRRRIRKAGRRFRKMPCVEALLRDGFKVEGCRNNTLFNAIQAIKRFDLPITPDDLAEANARSAHPLPERELQGMIRYHFEKRAGSSYFFSCEPMQQANLCPPQCCRLRRN